MVSKSYLQVILLMEEILHHLGWKKPANNGMNYLSSGAGFLPSTVGLYIDRDIPGFLHILRTYQHILRLKPEKRYCKVGPSDQYEWPHKWISVGLFHPTSSGLFYSMYNWFLGNIAPENDCFSFLLGLFSGCKILVSG